MKYSITRTCARVARGEMIKYRQARVLLGILGSLSFFTCAMAFISFHKKSAVPITAGYELALSFFGILVLCICATYGAQDFSLGTMRNLYLRTPSRAGIILGKVIAATILIFLLNAYLMVLSLSCALMQAQHLYLNDSLHSGKVLLAGFLGSCALGFFGTALGFITTSPVVAIGVGLLWSLVIESVMSASMKGSAPWLPIVNSVNLAQGGLKNVPAVSLTHSTVVVLGYLAFLFTLAFLTFLRAEIT